MTDEDLPHSTFQQFLTFLTNGFWTCGAMRSTKQWGVCVNAVVIAWVQFSVNCHPYSALVCISLAAVNFFAIPAGSYLYLINLNHSLRNLSRGRCCIPFVLACSRASMINAAQRRSININQNHFPLFFMAEAPVQDMQDMQDPPWKTEDGLALCAGRLQLDEFASFGFGEAELDIVGFQERPSKNTRFITFYDMRQYCFMREESQGEVVVAFVRVSPLSPQLYYTDRCFKQATTMMNIFMHIATVKRHACLSLGMCFSPPVHTADKDRKFKEPFSSWVTALPNAFCIHGWSIDDDYACHQAALNAEQPGQSESMSWKS